MWKIGSIKCNTFATSQQAKIGQPFSIHIIFLNQTCLKYSIKKTEDILNTDLLNTSYD